MKKYESVQWILDRPHTEIIDMKNRYPDHKEYLKHYWQWQDENYRQNIEFVHSLGLKCDKVGWSILDLDRRDAGDILDKIHDFCKNNGWLARGDYSCVYSDYQSDWYEIDAQHTDIEMVSCEEGVPYAIHAYKLPKEHLLLGWNKIMPVLVSEKFREVCLNYNINGVDFCPIKDVGKYDAPQYFFMFPSSVISSVICGKGLKFDDEFSPHLDKSENLVYKHSLDHVDHARGSELYKRLLSLGEYPPKLAEIFDKCTFYIPDRYRMEDMPKNGFAYICGSNDGDRREKLFVHKDTADILIKEKLIVPGELHPLLFCDDDIPEGYVEAEFKDDSLVKFDSEIAAKAQAEYDIIKSLKRPVKKATTASALKSLRNACVKRMEEFGKRMKKAALEELYGTEYEPLAPFYSVADGGWLNDEYKFLNQSSSVDSTNAYMESMKSEELCDIPCGTVFCICSDGDTVILDRDGRVLRINHEAPEILREWPCLAQFFSDITE